MIKINSSSAKLALLDIFEVSMKIKELNMVIEKQCDKVLDSDSGRLLLKKKKNKKKNTKEDNKNEKS